MRDYRFWFSWLWFLAVAILATILLAWFLYPFEIDWLSLDEQVIITPETLLENINHLFLYLTSPFQWVLDMPDFPTSASGLKHFTDVKYLFHLTELVAIILFYPSYRFFRYHLRQKSLILYGRGFVIMGIFPIFIGLVACLIGFDSFFTLFHQLLFPGDSSWLFNPATDPVIWVLPETYFLHCFILFFIIYECGILGLAFLARSQYKKGSIVSEEQSDKKSVTNTL